MKVKLKCPECGNEKKFVCDIVGTADYDQETDSLESIGDNRFNYENGYVACCQCRYQADYKEFEIEED